MSLQRLKVWAVLPLSLPRNYAQRARGSVARTQATYVGATVNLTEVVDTEADTVKDPRSKIFIKPYGSAN